MVLSDEDIIKFQALYMSRFGMEINPEVAREKGLKLLRLMKIIYKQMTREEFDVVQKRQKELTHWVP